MGNIFKGVRWRDLMKRSVDNGRFCIHFRKSLVWNSGNLWCSSIGRRRFVFSNFKVAKEEIILRRWNVRAEWALSLQEVMKKNVIVEWTACFVNEVDFTRTMRYRGSLPSQEWANGSKSGRSFFLAQSRLAQVVSKVEMRACVQAAQVFRCGRRVCVVEYVRISSASESDLHVDKREY